MTVNGSDAFEAARRRYSAVRGQPDADPPTPVRLFHYTCDHGLAGIVNDGAVVPRYHPVIGGRPVVWLTHEIAPTRAALGLSSHNLKCDRMQHRIAVDTTTAVHWYAARAEFYSAGVLLLEAARGARPASWWVSFDPIPFGSD